VLAKTAAANRDPDIYNDPDRLDITREGPSAMLTFGGGTHDCLGSHLVDQFPGPANPFAGWEGGGGEPTPDRRTLGTRLHGETDPQGMRVAF
jgi:hypothetical protein